LPGELPIAKVVTNGSAIVAGGITDLRTWFVDSQTQGQVLRVDLMAGANLGAKLSTCFNSLTQGGETCDARGLSGAQTISANPFANLTHPVNVLLGPGMITTVPLVMPDTWIQGVRIEGAGVGGTFFTPSAANQPIFQGSQISDGSICDECYLGHFSVVAHPSGSTGTAIDTTGFRDSTFEDIEYWDSNWGSGGGQDWNSFFHFAAYPNLDYGNRVLHPFIDGSGSPTTVFLFDNGGTGNSANNAHVTYIINPEIYLNSGITTVFDARRSALTVIRGGGVEANPGAVVLIPGTQTTLEDMWLESNATVPVVPQTGSDGGSSSVTLLGNYIYPAFTLTIPSWSSNWTIADNYPAGNLTVTDNGTNDFVRVGATANNLSVTGTLGVGTSNPQAALDVTSHGADNGTSVAVEDFVGSDFYGFSEDSFRLRNPNYQSGVGQEVFGVGAEGFLLNTGALNNSDLYIWDDAAAGGGGADKAVFQSGLGKIAFGNAITNSNTLSGAGLVIDSANHVGIGTTSPQVALDINSDRLRVETAHTPASSSESCYAGTVAWDTSYVYVCTVSNTWKRVALSSF
jgi:hypothetical protein